MPKIIAICFISSMVLLFSMHGNKSKSVSAPRGPLPFGDYVVLRTAGGAGSEEDLIRLDRCINAHDQECGVALLRDGRAFELTPGTLVRGSEQSDGIIFSGTVESGTYVGRTVFFPVGALK